MKQWLQKIAQESFEDELNNISLNPGVTGANSPAMDYQFAPEVVESPDEEYMAERFDPAMMAPYYLPEQIDDTMLASNEGPDLSRFSIQELSDAYNQMAGDTAEFDPNAGLV